MGLLGKYIDALSAEERDRIIRAQDWLSSEFDTVVGVVKGSERPRQDGTASQMVRWWVAAWRRRMSVDSRARKRLRNRFLRARERLGTERLVRLIKLRAARPNRPLVETPSRRRDPYSDRW